MSKQFFSYQQRAVTSRSRYQVISTIKKRLLEVSSASSST